MLNSEWDKKFYFFHLKFDEVGTTLKHPKNLSRRIENKDKENATFTLRIQHC